MTDHQSTRPLPPLFLSSLSNRGSSLADTTALSQPTTEYQPKDVVIDDIDHYRPNARVDSDDSDEDAAEAPPSLMIEMDPRASNHPSHRTLRDGARTSARGRGKPRFFRFAGNTRPPERLPSSDNNRSLVQIPSGQTLDTFFSRVYSYFVGKGFSCIVLSRIFNLLTLAFVVCFSTFLVGCVDFRRIRNSNSLEQVLIPHCISRLPFLATFFLVIFAIFWVWQLIRLVQEIGELKEMRYYYGTILQISDEDIQTIAWKDVVNRVVEMRHMLPSATSKTPGESIPGNMRLSAHDVANRIMRKENFMIALFNKDIFDLSLPVVPLLRSRQVLTRTLEWNLSFCVLGFVFNKDGQVRKRFLRDVKRAELVAGLRRRFIFMGFVNVIFAPFIVIYLLMFFFFRYFEEFYKNPSSIGSRQYSPFARWKFREFNELPHYFQQRLNHSYQNAVKYIGQFPQENTAIIARFVAFIAGSFAAVLVVMTLADQELLLGFELSKDRTVFFYISVFGAILAVARSLIPDENLVFEPERLLLAVVEDTHYLVDEWNGKLHTNEVKTDFAVFFEYKVIVFIQEILSVIFTPWVLWFSLPNCTEAVVDFFREFTVHVDGVGYVCSFAVFDFRRHGNARYGAPTSVNDERYLSKNGKMEKSFVNFKVNHPEWQPSDEVGSQYLSRLNDFNAQHRHRAPISSTSETSEASHSNHMMASLADVDQLHASIMQPRALGNESPVLQAPPLVPPSRLRPQSPHFPAERQVRAGHPALRPEKATQRPPALPGLYLSAAAAEARQQELSPGSSMMDSSCSVNGRNRGAEGMLALLNQFYEQSQQPI